MKIFITGATGFLGTHLCTFLRAQGHEVTAVGSSQCNLRRADSLTPYSSTRWDQIYHLAAWTQAGDFCLRHPGEQWIVNQEINTTILRWWHEQQPQAKMIAIGTSCCYQPGTPHVEESFLTGQPIESLFTYAMTKRMLLAGLQALHKQFGLRYLFVVPSTLYGADYHLDGRQMHFIFDLLRKIVDGKRIGSPVVLWGDGTQRRELIHVRSFVEGMYALAQTVDNDIFNIGGGIEYPIRWYAETLCEHVGYDASLIEYDTSKYVGATSKVLCIDKIKQALPTWEPIPLRAGLAEIVDWYLESTGGTALGGNSPRTEKPLQHTVTAV
jgi:GDP-L-fucose synthase